MATNLGLGGTVEQHLVDLGTMLGTDRAAFWCLRHPFGGSSRRVALFNDMVVSESESLGLNVIRVDGSDDAGRLLTIVAHKLGLSDAHGSVR